MKKLHDETRGKIIYEIMKIVDPNTTVETLELTITSIERILIAEKILK